jgi:hypothetical protein
MGMTNWKTKVVLTDLHEAFEGGDITVSEVAEALADRLEKNPYHKDLEDLIEELRSGDLTEVDDYDDVLMELYDFGDEDHRIWFEMF